MCTSSSSTSLTSSASALAFLILVVVAIVVVVVLQPYWWVVSTVGSCVTAVVLSSFFVRIYLFGGHAEREVATQRLAVLHSVRNGALPSDMKCSVDLFNRPSGSFW